MVPLLGVQTARALTLSIVDPGQGPVLVGMNGQNATELSGITWAGSNLYYAVSDGGYRWRIKIDTDPITGTVVSSAVQPGSINGMFADWEGIAYNRIANSVFICNEAAISVVEYAAWAGTVLRTVSIPPVMQNVQWNKSIEAVTLQRGGVSLWTCNEEALSCDGTLSTPTNGTIVRLLKYDANLNAVGQWAYLTDPLHIDYNPPGRTDYEVAGVPDLLVLPDGRLIIMERSGWRYEDPGKEVRIRLYLADFTGATDVSGFAALAGATYSLTGKTLLWERSFDMTKFEGITLGPQIGENEYVLIMTSDTTFSSRNEILALRLRGVSGAAIDDDGDGLPDYWENRHGGNLVPGNDEDTDGLTNREEYDAGTDPTNRLSRLVVTGLTSMSESGANISWQSVTNRSYIVRSVSLTGGPPANVSSSIPGGYPCTTATVSTAFVPALFFQVIVDD